MLVGLIAFHSGCTGELSTQLTPPPPADPHAVQDDGVRYWDSLVDPTGSSALYAVAGLTGDEVVLAGEAGGVWRWDGVSLTGLGTLTLSDGTAPALNGLWAHKDEQGILIYAVGEHGAIFCHDRPGAITLEAFELQDTSTAAAFYGVIGFSRDDVWAVGDGGVYHFDGVEWARDTSVPGSSRLAGVWGTGPDDLYAVGPAGEGGSTLLHRDAAGWSRISLGLSIDLHAVWGTGAGPVFVVGQQGTVVRFDGSSWTVQDTGTFEHLWSVWGLSETQVFAAGTNGTTLFFDGSSWQRLESGSSRNLYGLWGPDVQHVFVSGAWSTFLRFDNDPAPSSTP